MAEIGKFDLFLFHILNGLSGQRFISYAADYLQGINLGALLMMAGFWWFWFRSEERHQRLIVAIFIGAIGSLIVARSLASVLPFRLRPMYELGIRYQVPKLPEATHPDFKLEGWSSFPSDHAALYFALSYGLWLLSPTAGIAAFTFAIIAAGLARIIIGIHYPSDILGGALIGIGSVIASRWLLGKTHYKLIFYVRDQHPHVFYSIMFIFTAETAVLFDDVRFFMRGMRIALHDFGCEACGLFESLIIGAAGLLAMVVAAICIGWVIWRLRRPPMMRL